MISKVRRDSKYLSKDLMSSLHMRHQFGAQLEIRSQRKIKICIHT